MAKQSEVESLKSSVSSGKAQIASAITDKGVSTSSSASFSTMASNINKINEGMPTLITKSALGTATTSALATGSSVDGMYVTGSKSGMSVSFTFYDDVNSFTYNLGGITLSSAKNLSYSGNVAPDCSTQAKSSNVFYIICFASSTATGFYHGYKVYKYTRSSKSMMLDKSATISADWNVTIPPYHMNRYLGYCNGTMYGLNGMNFWKYSYSNIGTKGDSGTRISGGPGYGDEIPLRGIYAGGSGVGVVMENRFYILGGSGGYNTFSTSNVIYDQYNGAIYNYTVAETSITAKEYSPTGNSWSTLGTIPINQSGYARGSNFTVHGVTPTHIIFSYTPSSGGNKLYRIYRFSGTALEYFWRADSNYYSNTSIGIYFFGQTKQSGKSGMELRASKPKYVNEFYMPGIAQPIVAPTTAFKYFGSTASTSYPTIVD